MVHSRVISKSTLSEPTFGVRRRAARYLKQKRRLFGSNEQRVLAVAGGGVLSMPKVLGPQYYHPVAAAQPSIVYSGPVYNNCKFYSNEPKGLTYVNRLQVINSQDGRISFKKRRMVEEECVEHKD